MGFLGCFLIGNERNTNVYLCLSFHLLDVFLDFFLLNPLGWFFWALVCLPCVRWKFYLNFNSYNCLSWFIVTVPFFYIWLFYLPTLPYKHLILHIASTCPPISPFGAIILQVSPSFRICTLIFVIFFCILILNSYFGLISRIKSCYNYLSIWNY